jgi:hypothetical protein
MKVLWKIEMENKITFYTPFFLMLNELSGEMCKNILLDLSA